MIEVDLPDGSVAEFPDGTDPETIKGALQKKFGAPKPGMLEDVGRSAVAGLRQGVEGLLGTVGNVQTMQGDALAWGAEKLGAGQGMQDVVRSAGRFLSPILPGAINTEELQQGTDRIFGEAYEPQTVPGEYARTVGQFAPAAVAGPGGLARTAAMTVAPAVASETAGQVTKGTAAEPYARIAGALLGGGAAAGRPVPAMVKGAAKGAPTREALQEQTTKLYRNLEDAGITYDATAWRDTIAGLPQKLRNAGFRERAHAPVYAWAKDLADDVAKGVVPDFREVESLRQMTGGMARGARASADGPTRNLGRGFDEITDALDDFTGSASFVSRAGLTGKQLAAKQQEARSIALKNIKQGAIDDAVSTADVAVGGQEAGIRAGLRTLLRSKRGQKLFNEPERKALLEVANGRKALQQLSRFGFDIRSIGGNAAAIPALGTYGAVSAGGPPGFALPLAGTAAKFASPAMTQKALDRVSAAIRSGNLAGPEALAQQTGLQRGRIVRALLAGGSGVQSARTNTVPQVTYP